MIAFAKPAVAFREVNVSFHASPNDSRSVVTHHIFTWVTALTVFLNSRGSFFSKGRRRTDPDAHL